MLERIIGCVLSLVFVFSSVPVHTFAEEKRTIFLNTNSSFGFPHISKTTDNSELCGFKYKEDEKLYYFHCSSDADEVGAGTMKIEGIDSVSKYVYQIDVFPKLKEKNAYLGFIEEGEKSCVLLMLEPDGTLWSGNNKNEICNIPMGAWTSIAAICDLTTGKVVIHVNGEEQKTVDFEDNLMLPTTLAIGMRFKEENSGEIWVNRLKIYEGSEVREFNDVGPETNILDYPTLNDTKADAIKMLDKDSVFMTSAKTYFLNGEKKSYTESTGFAYLNDNNVVMVPAVLAEEMFNTEIEYSDGIVTVGENEFSIQNTQTNQGKLDARASYEDGILYLPIASIAELFFNKYAYRDERGFVLVSDTERNYVNSVQEIENQETADIIYRFMQFDRPSGDELYRDMQKISGETYPRMFVKKDEMSDIKEKLDLDEELYQTFYGNDTKEGVLWHCDNMVNNLTDPLVKYLPASDGNYFYAASRLRDYVMQLSSAYYVTQDSKYLDRMWTEVKSVLEWPSWNLMGQYLATSKMAVGIAMAYDVLQGHLSSEEKTYFKEKVIDLYLNYAIGTYSGTSSYSAKDYKVTSNNWGACTSAGSLLVALAFMGDEPENSEIAYKCKYLAENSLQSLEYVIGHLYPDGCCGEGLEYSKYFTESLCWSINALINACGTDYGLLSAPGFREIVNESLYLQSANGAFNYDNYTEDATIQFVPETFLVAKFYNDSTLMATLNEFRKSLGIEFNIQGLLWYEPVESSVANDVETEMLFKGQKIVMMRSPWEDKLGSYLAIRSGFNWLNGHLDKGTFVFDCDGERWICDLGKDNYEVDGGYYFEDGFTLYRKKTEGHNCLVINPDKTSPGQKPEGYADVIKYDVKPKGGITVLDLSDVYDGQVSEYIRGFYYGEDRRSLVVQDEIELSQDENDIYWFLHTKGDIDIDDSGKSATITQNGKKLRVEVYCDASSWTLSKQNAEYIYPEMQRENEDDRSAYSKIALVGKGSGKINISAKLFVEDDGNLYDEAEFVPIENWEIPDGEIKALAKIHEIFSNITSNDEKITIELGESEEAGNMYVAKYDGNRLDSVEKVEWSKNKNIEINQGEHYKIFMWDDKLTPVTEKLEFK